MTSKELLPEEQQAMAEQIMEQLLDGVANATEWSVEVVDHWEPGWGPWGEADITLTITLKRHPDGLLMLPYSTRLEQAQSALVDYYLNPGCENRESEELARALVKGREERDET
jgi:hypothetical protein